MKETEELKTHKCSKCGEQVVLECFEYDDCDNYKPRLRLLMRIYNTGYHAGHEDTVEGRYTDVLPVDMDSYHNDTVEEWLEEWLKEKRA